MLTYEQREKIKASCRPIMNDACMPLRDRMQAAFDIMLCLYCRSCEAIVGQNVDKEYVTSIASDIGHPSVFSYMSMLLNQGAEPLGIPQDVYDAMVKRIGKREGIPSGTYFTLNGNC